MGREGVNGVDDKWWYGACRVFIFYRKREDAGSENIAVGGRGREGWAEHIFVTRGDWRLETGQWTLVTLESTHMLHLQTCREVVF